MYVKTLSFAKSLRGITRISCHVMKYFGFGWQADDVFARRKMLAENVNRALSGFQEGEFGLQNYSS